MCMGGVGYVYGRGGLCVWEGWGMYKGGVVDLYNKCYISMFLNFVCMRNLECNIVGTEDGAIYMP